MAGSPALGTGDSSERAGSLSSGASGWGQIQAGQQYHNSEGMAWGLPSAVMVGSRELGWAGDLAFAAVSCTAHIPAVLAPRKELLAVTTPHLWTARHLCIYWTQGWSASLLCRLHPG